MGAYDLLPAAWSRMSLPEVWIYGHSATSSFRDPFLKIGFAKKGFAPSNPVLYELFRVEVFNENDEGGTPVLDMLRFNKFTIGKAWESEYGNPDDPMDFEFIYKYSPLHQLAIRPGKQWPSTMVMTAEHDDRVVPMHTLKYIAQLYHLLAKEANDFQENPVLARIEENAGHGGGKPLSKKIDSLVDVYSFIQNALNLTWTDGAASLDYKI